MRRRLLLSTLAVAVVAVLLLGIPLAVMTHRLIYEEAREQLSAQATTLVKEVELRRGQQQPIEGDEISSAYTDRYIEIQMPDGRMITAGKKPPSGESLLTERASAFGIYVEVSQSSAEVEADALRVLMFAGVLAALGIGVAVALAMVQARKLTLPLVDLATTAERIGSGNVRPRRHRYGIPEVDSVAEVLDRSSVRVADLLAASREFASDASHQLRTPLTALSMRIEEMMGAAEYPDVVREEGAAALNQTERLVDVVEHLLARAKHDPTGGAVATGVDDIVGQQVEEWGQVFSRAGREVRVTGEQGLIAFTSAGGLSQIIATLLDNSLVHGDGNVTITTREEPTNIVVEVGDHGPGVPAELEGRIFDRSVTSGKGTGLGLYLARSMAAADGGRLELMRPRPAVFAIFLRKVEEAQLARERVVSGPV